jgi:hypothetical protein
VQFEGRAPNKQAYTVNSFRAGYLVTRASYLIRAGSKPAGLLGMRTCEQLRCCQGHVTEMARTVSTAERPREPHSVKLRAALGEDELH